MAYTPALYRLVIVDPTSANVFAPGDATVHDDHLWVTSSRDPAEHNYITSPPSDDGDRLDVLSSNVEEGACKIGVSDASEYVTNRLTNAAGRGQMIGSAAYCEVSNDGGTTWDLVRHGFVTDVELPRAQEFLFTIGGTRRRERNTPVSRILSGLDFSGIIFHPTAIIGGPIFGGLPGYQRDFGLPKFTVAAVQGGILPDNEQWVRLRHTSGPLPPFFAGPDGQPQRPMETYGGNPHQPGTIAHAEAINNMAATYFDGAGAVIVISGQQTFLRGRFRNVNVLLYDASLSLVQQNLTAQAQGVTLAGAPYGPANWFMSPNKDIYLVGFNTLPSVSDVFSLAAVPTEITEDFPAWYSGHPVEVAVVALDAIDAAVEGTSTTATLNALGRSLFTTGRLTDPKQTVSDWLNNEGAFWGYALVPNDDTTEFAIIPTRDWATPGAVTIDNDSLRAIGGPTYSLTGNSRRNMLRARVMQFVPWFKEMDVPRPYSDLVPFEVPFPIPYELGADDPQQVIDLTLPGTVATQCHLVQPVYFPPVPLQAQDFLEAMAARLFNRHGQGTPEYVVRLTGRQDPADVRLGSLLTIDTTHIPNAVLAASPTSQRGGPRPVRIISRTTEPEGDDLTCIDEGDGVPYAGTFDIDDFAVGPTPDSAIVSLSGGIQLGTDGAIVTIYISHMPAGTSTEPTDNGTPIVTMGGDGVNDITGYEDLGPLPTGVIWWIRADAFVEGGGVSASTAWWSLNGPATPGPTPPTPTGDISALVVSDIGTDYAVLTWTNTNTTENIRVSFKLGTDTLYTVVATLPPGSITYTIFGLVPATAYDFQVEMISSSGTVWTTLTASDTTDAGTPSLVLYTPLNPRAWAGSMGGISTLGSVGLLVQPVFNTVHEVEFEMTPETAVGSGIPDGWPSDVTPAADSATQFWPITSATPGVNGSVDVFSIHNVPNDGRLRYFRARARKLQSDGSFIYSGWTAVVSVMPWIVFVPLPPPGAGSVVDGGTAYVTGPNQVDGGSDVANNTYSGPPLEGGSA